MRLAFALALMTFPLGLPATAQTSAADLAAKVAEAVDTHVIPGFAALKAEADELAGAAQDNCAPDNIALREAWSEAFDAWLGVSHLRFGPTEVNERGFALTFWPDPRGATPRTLGVLIADQDPIGLDAEAYADMSVAARGFHAMEFLLFDEQLSVPDETGYHCELVRTVAGDIANVAAELEAEWAAYGVELKSPTPDSEFRTAEEAARALFGSLSTGLEFNFDARLGRPMGTFDRPRPTRAENRRSGRSLRNVIVTTEAQRDLALAFADDGSELEAELEKVFDATLTLARGLDDPAFAGVAEPIGRIRVEAIQTSIRDIRQTVALGLGASLGIAAGFNALDGD
ncbi:MAG: imelysin family protein [Pseudomonadota bacterium]